jgi:hypothetical protein
MPMRGANAVSVTVRFEASVWTTLGRLAREEFAELQGAIETQAKTLSSAAVLAESGELAVCGYRVRYEVEPERRVLTVTSVKPVR